ncbi:putative RNA methylase domain [Trypanosoma melophagium]|uniref:putative RNA methylase domain n=1 Tax=Trypanosoma melophagium TaxID=715481 RepID=UPI00351A0ADA|nr:putative RNA methylase domain [Trypanosoma melophagium]
MLFFAWFACNATLSPFCVEELRAAATTLGVCIQLQERPPWLCINSSTTITTSSPSSSSSSSSSLFCVFDAPSVKVARQLAERCVLLRAVYLLFAAAPSVEELIECIGSDNNKNNNNNSTEGNLLRGEKYQQSQEEQKDSFNSCTLRVETIGRHYTVEEKTALATRVSHALGIIPPDNTSHPQKQQQQEEKKQQQEQQQRICVLLEHALENAPAGSPASWVPCGRVLRAFCGLLVADSPRQELLSKYDLKRRLYIGTTSMPPEPAFVMVHMACVRRGACVFDPFCGTGGILVAAAHCGAITIGADADGRAMQKGTSRHQASKQQQQQREVALRAYKPEDLQRAQITLEETETPSVMTNFKLYGLTPPDRVRLNFANWRKVWRPCTKAGNPINDSGFLDAIVTDPPYGIREPRRKAVEQQTQHENFYPVSSIILDLMLFAAEALVLGGRLVLWYPTTVQYTKDELPTHPSLTLIDDIPQRISLKMVRRLIVMEKTKLVPFPRPSRESCAARQQQSQDLRELMDTTELPDNSEYMHYRAKLQKKRNAAKRYFSSTSSHTLTLSDDANNNNNNNNNNNPNPNPSEAASESKALRKKMSKMERQELIVANRERNLQRQQQQKQQHRETSGGKGGDEID